MDGHIDLIWFDKIYLVLSLLHMVIIKTAPYRNKWDNKILNSKREQINMINMLKDQRSLVRNTFFILSLKDGYERFKWSNRIFRETQESLFAKMLLPILKLLVLWISNKNCLRVMIIWLVKLSQSVSCTVLLKSL